MSDLYVETNGIRLHCLRYAGHEPTLVLAPGLTANAHSFDGLVEAGLPAVARVLALDLRGRGESDQPASGYTMEDHARDVSASSTPSASSASSWEDTPSAGC